MEINDVFRKEQYDEAYAFVQKNLKTTIKALSDGWYQLVEILPPSVEEQNEAIRQQRSMRMTAEADPLKYDYEEAVARGAANAEELKAVWLAKKDEIREQLSYLPEKASEEIIPEA